MDQGDAITMPKQDSLPEISFFTQDDLAFRAVAQAFSLAGLADVQRGDMAHTHRESGHRLILVDTKSAETMPEDERTQRLSFPCKIGALIDIVSQRLQRQRSSYRLGDLMFNPVSGVLTAAQEERIVLTEKERDLLLFLLERRGHVIRREDLLGKIWGYADDIETHTLETHIYRLRQKIEPDPSCPVFLLTQENGYCIPMSKE